MDEKDYKFLKLVGTLNDSFIEKAHEPWPRQRTSSRWARHGVFKAACAVLILACGMLGALHPQVNAAVQELFSRIGQIAGREEAFAPYASSMDLAQTKGGVTLTLQEAVMSDNQLYVALSMDTDLEKAELGDFHISFDALEENIHTTYSGGYLPGSSRENGYVLKYSFEDGTLPRESADITLTVDVYRDGEEWRTSKTIPFEFTFSSSVNELAENTLQISLDQEIELKPGLVLELESFSLNSIFSRIRTKCGTHNGSSLPLNKTMYYLKGTDSLGNEILYTYQAENGPYGYFATEETLENSPPSLDCEWIELQVYTQDIQNNMDMTPIGEKFRINLPA